MLMQVIIQCPVLSFPDQSLSLDEFEAFAAQLGDFYIAPFVRPVPNHPYMVAMHRRKTDTTAYTTEIWHMDGSYEQCPPGLQILHANILPSLGGGTWLADSSAAWEGLTSAQQNAWLDLEVFHSTGTIYGKGGVYSQEEDKEVPWTFHDLDGPKIEALHPLVRTDRRNGRRSLSFNPLGQVYIDGLSKEESEKIFEQLRVHLTQPEYCYLYRYQPNSLLLWDNQRVLHRAEGHPSGRERLLYRLALQGV